MVGFRNYFLGFFISFFGRCDRYGNVVIIILSFRFGRIVLRYYIEVCIYL